MRISTISGSLYYKINRRLNVYTNILAAYWIQGGVFFFLPFPPIEPIFYQNCHPIPVEIIYKYNNFANFWLCFMDPRGHQAPHVQAWA